MQVRFLGFRFTTDAPTLTLQTFANYVQSNHGVGFESGAHKRLLFINSTFDKNYYVGLFVTVKDQKTFCELVSKGGKLVVKVNELDKQSDLMDFNFFVINKNNGLCLYQYYHQSCSLSSFGFYNSKRFTEHRNTEIDGQLAEIGKLNLTPAKERIIRGKFKGQLKWEILVRKEKLKTLIEELDQVNSFEYSFLTLTTEEPEFKPISNFLRKKSTKIAFTKGSPVEKLAEFVSNFLSSRNIETGKVTGVDTDGITRVLRVTDNPDNFGDYGYDDIAPRINSMDIDKFENSWIIKELLSKCTENKHIFEAKIK